MTEVLGCGIDIEDINRFSKYLSGSNKIPPFSHLVFSDSEIENNISILPEITFPLGFSCKEAFFKALGISWTNSNISWKDIELLFHNKEDLKEYSIRLNGFAMEKYNEKRCTKINSSFEYTGSYVIFQIILVSN